jgi:transcriptional regulator GlxA family with amidase domain
MAAGIRSVSIVLFDGFELLDVFGPAELFSMERERLATRYIAPTSEPVASIQGVAVVPDCSYADAPRPDIVLVPGGLGTRRLVEDAGFLAWLREWAGGATLVTSVCTGSAVLAAAGLLDGHRATSNKRAFAWASTHGAAVEWVPAARWVEDRDRWTSSGVAAGMDMAAALLGSLFGADAAREAAESIELELHTDPSWDPFAKLNGLAG